MKHGQPVEVFTEKMVRLTEHARFAESYTPVEQEVLKFADHFATDPKAYADINRLKTVLQADNARRYKTNASQRRAARLDAAREARARGLLDGLTGQQLDEFTRAAAANAPMTFQPRSMIGWSTPNSSNWRSCAFNSWRYPTCSRD